MAKVTPNPPAADEPTSRVQSARNKKIDDAATRALDFYLKPKPEKETSDKSDSILRIDPGVDSECLLANLSENLASANAISVIWRLIWMVRGGVLRWGFCR